MIYCQDFRHEIEQVRSNCYSFLNDYQYRVSKTKSHGVPSTINPPLAESRASLKKDMNNLVAFLSTSSSTIHVKSKMDHYLDKPVLP